MRKRLTAAMDTLPEKERLILTLYYYEELTMREISQIISVNASTVSHMHSSAIARLRVSLSSDS